MRARAKLPRQSRQQPTRSAILGTYENNRRSPTRTLLSTERVVTVVGGALRTTRRPRRETLDGDDWESANSRHATPDLESHLSRDGRGRRSHVGQGINGAGRFQVVVAQRPACACRHRPPIRDGTRDTDRPDSASAGRHRGESGSGRPDTSKAWADSRQERNKRTRMLDCYGPLHHD